MEVILVNDYSTDRTEEIILDFIKDKNNFKLIKPEKDFGATIGKARAIANGIEIANGEIILTTDADCAVSPTWVKTIASYYLDDVAVVCGYTNQEWSNIFEGVQDMDFIFLLTVGAGTINWGKPVSAIGNNMSYRKSVYNEVGGYANIPFSVTEDSQLLMAINNLKKYKIIYPLDREGLVTSNPCKDLKTLHRQKKRWAVGGLNSKLDGMFVIFTALFVTLFTLLIPFFYSATVMYIYLLKVFADFFMLYFVYKHLKLKFSFTNFIGFQIYLVIYFISTSLSLLFSRKVNWKGREF